MQQDIASLRRGGRKEIKGEFYISPKTILLINNETVHAIRYSFPSRAELRGVLHIPENHFAHN